MRTYQETVRGLFKTNKDVLLSPIVSADSFLSALEVLETLSVCEEVGREVIDFLTKTNLAEGAESTKPLVEVVINSDRSDGGKVAEYYFKTLLKLSAGGLISAERPAEIFAEFANKSVTKKASPGSFDARAKRLSLAYKEVKGIECATTLLKPDAKTLLVDFSEEFSRNGPFVMDKVLTCFCYGFAMNLVSRAGLLRFITGKIRAGSQDVLEEILDPNSYLMRLIQDEFYPKISSDNVRDYIDLNLAVSDAVFARPSASALAKLLNFLKAEFKAEKRIFNIAHLVGSNGSRSDCEKFIDILMDISQQDPAGVLVYLQLGVFSEKMSQPPVGYFGFYLLNCDLGPRVGEESLVDMYITLLESISNSLGDDSIELIQHSLSLSVSRGSNFVEEVCKKLPHRKDFILRLMLDNFLSPDVLEKLKGLKHAVADELIELSRDLEPGRAVRLLSLALTRDSFLGKYFYLQRASKPCAVGQGGSLDIIFAELQKRDSTAAASFAPASAKSGGVMSLLFSRSRAGSVDLGLLGDAYESLTPETGASLLSS